MREASAKIILLITLLLSCYGHSAAQVDQLDNQFRQSKLLARHHYGFSLYDLDSNRSVYAHQAHQLFTPASNTKLYTLYAALAHISDSIPGLQYVERGDSLIFWGTGDPTFLHPQLDNGRVYSFLKNTEKELFYLAQENPEGPFRPGWTMEDYNFSYQRDIVPFPIYGNLVQFSARHGQIEASPRYFKDKLTPSQQRKGHFYIHRHLGQNVFEMRGAQVPRSAFTSSKPFVWSDSLFVHLLSDTLARSVELLQDLAIGADEQVHTFHSTSRDLLLREMMLPSDNFLAEQLTMVAAYQCYGHFWTDTLRQDLAANAFATFADTTMIWDGSGLSVYNKTTPENLISLLISLRDKLVDPYALRMFFPAGGIDGTLKNAYRVGDRGPFVWAKTGTLRSVYCQSGYIHTKSGRNFAFSFLNNNFRGSATPVRQEIGRLVTFIYENF